MPPAPFSTPVLQGPRPGVRKVKKRRQSGPHWVVDLSLIGRVDGSRTRSSLLQRLFRPSLPYSPLEQRKSISTNMVRCTCLLALGFGRFSKVDPAHSCWGLLTLLATSRPPSLVVSLVHEKEWSTLPSCMWWEGKQKIRLQGASTWREVGMQVGTQP